MMPFAPLILKGNLTIGVTAVPTQVTAFKFMGQRSQIDIPATFGSRKSFAAGTDEYSIQIDYLQDIDATALSELFFTAMGDATGTLLFTGSVRSGVVSATNPKWVATGLVTAWDLGGEVNTIGLSSVTFPLLDRPVRTIVP